MSGPDYRMQQEAEEERSYRLHEILDRASKARNAGYFTQEDIEDMQREFGLSTRQTQTQTETI